MNPAMMGAIDTWRRMHRHYLSLQHRALELFSHPDATDERVLYTARALGRTRQYLIDSRRQLVTHKDYPRTLRRSPTIEEMKL